jgi:alpha-tubulin suppressor-like RCC1 family protein
VRFWGAPFNNTPGAKDGSVHEIGGFRGFVAVSMSRAHACGIDRDGGVWCLGSDRTIPNWGTHGDGPLPSPIVGLPRVVSIAVGWYHACAIDESGGAWCWGKNRYGQIGNGSVDDDPALFETVRPPVQVGAFIGALVDIAAGAGHTCAVDRSAGVWCWGLNRFGQVGDSTVGERRGSPTRVAGISGALRVAVGRAHSCALLASGTVTCWGSNEWGQVGNGLLDASDRVAPTAVPALSGIVEIAAGYEHTCVVNTGGEVWCWGSNEGGELGVAPESVPSCLNGRRCSPVPVRALLEN